MFAIFWFPTFIACTEFFVVFLSFSPQLQVSVLAALSLFIGGNERRFCLTGGKQMPEISLRKRWVPPAKLVNGTKALGIMAGKKVVSGCRRYICIKILLCI